LSDAENDFKVSTVKLAEEDLINLINVLTWAKSTADFCSKAEVQAGHTAEDVQQLRILAASAGVLIKFFQKSVDIGEPTNDVLH